MPRRPSSIIGVHAELRDEWRHVNGMDYIGAQTSNYRRKRRGLGGGADAHYYSESRWLEMMEYVRDMDRNDRFIGPITDRLVDNVVRNGFEPEPQTGDKKLDTDLKQRHEAWAKDKKQCDVAANLDFSSQQRLVFRQRILDGGMFALPITDPDDESYGALQLLEYDRCRTPTARAGKPNIVHGIEVDGRLRAKRYYFVRSVANPFSRYLKLTDADPIDAMDEEGHPRVLHISKPSRISQTRGMTGFHGCFDAAQILEDIDFGEMIRRKIASSIGLSIETDKDAPEPQRDVQLGDRTSTIQRNGFEDILETMSPGMILRPPKGKSVKLLGSNAIPGEQYVQHYKLILQSIGACVGMPLIAILLDAADSSFSGWRGAMDQAKIAFVCEQYIQEVTFCRPVYEGNVRRWIEQDPDLAKSAKKKSIDIFKHIWHYPGWAYVQPLQDAQANMVRVNTGQSSPRRVAAENGDRFVDIVDEAVADTELWIDLALTAYERQCKKHPGSAKDLHWTMFYHRDFPRGVQILDTQQEPAPAQAKSDTSKKNAA